jgi:LPXTG-site transpeptidase (sortase) family protein
MRGDAGAAALVITAVYCTVGYIAGHIDSAKSGAAVFYDLHKLKPGDTVQVDRGGQTVVFSVTDVEQYPNNAFPTAQVYQPTPDAELRLITCGGAFDRRLPSYRDNIVVYAVRVPGV